MTTRRNFIKKVVGSGVMLSTVPSMLQANTSISSSTNAKKLRIALIGKGGMGTADTNTALQVPDTKLVAVCDLYDARLALAKEQWGNDIETTKNYKEILQRKDVDVVIVATPDHWHQTIAIEAMKAGKHVYCEKPVIHKISEGKALIDAQKVSGSYFQTGSQGMSSLGNRKARQLVLGGIIGKVNFVDGQFTSLPRPLGEYKIPEDASEETIWWKQFIGNAPYHKFAPQRFFYWRYWKDYSTGIAGDLYVHVLASIHYITNASGPSKVYTTGGLRYYTDGYRDTPDVMLGYLDYPNKDDVGAFTVQLGANYVDGISKKWGSMNFRINGSEGSLEVEWNKVTLRTIKEIDKKTLESFELLGQGIDEPQFISPTEIVFQVSEGYKGGHYDHFNHFFESIRKGTPNIPNVLFGVQSAAPALLCYESYTRGEAIHWDPENLVEI